MRNPHRGAGLPRQPGLATGTVIADPTEALALFARCPVAAPTPMHDVPGLARALDIDQLHLKDERQRMGLGSFKALGAAHAIARRAADLVDVTDAPADQATMSTALTGTTFVCASAGNHGMSVSAAAPVFGAEAVVHLSHAVPEAFAQRLRARGARVVRAGHDYEASMAAAAEDAETHGWTLLSDSSWPGHVDLPTRVMEGYLVMGAEAADVLVAPPSHVVLQAGVGGLAAAMSALVRDRWGDAPTIIVVEPETAPALQESIRAGRPVTAAGPASSMGRLDCKDPSHLALTELARSADHFVTVSDERCEATVALLEAHGITTTPSGAAGVAAVHHAGQGRDALGLSADSHVLAIITEGPEDAT